MSDREMASDLTGLDPASTDPAYWDRFHERTMDRARLLLEARARRRLPRLGLQLVSWGRMVTPAAALAAGLAALVLVSEVPEMEVASAPMTELEEIVNQELVRAGLPAHYSHSARGGIDAFILAIEDVSRGEW